MKNKLSFQKCKYLWWKCQSPSCY